MSLLSQILNGTDIGAHWSHDKERLKFPIFCKKCKSTTNRKTKSFWSINSLYKHIICVHSDLDKNIPPTKNECLEDLRIFTQKLSEVKIE